MNEQGLTFKVGEGQIQVAPERVVVAGFTGRDRAAAMEHIRELAAEKVPVPESIPSFYQLPSHVLTQADTLTVTGAFTSGEVEVALIVNGSERYVTIASDHTDRMVERQDIGLSKLVCPKVLGTEVWALKDVLEHYDNLEMRSWIQEEETEAWALYQQGLASSLIPLVDLVEEVPFAQHPKVFVLLGGTVAARGGIRAARRFKAEIRDGASGRVLTLEYGVQVLEQLVGST